VQGLGLRVYGIGYRGGRCMWAVVHDDDVHGGHASESWRCILNPKPHTLNPKPQTLSPKP